jgi:hypothetical protein
MIFKKKSKIDITKLTDRVIDETKICNSCLQILEDSGNYKKRQNYKISDYDLKEKLKEIRNKFVILQTNVIIADEIIKINKKQLKLYNDICHDLNNEILKRQCLKIKNNDKNG